MPPVTPVRGTHDILPDDLSRHRHVEETARAVAARYGYREMAIPIFEFTEVFARSLGETSDVVAKEMYTFADKGATASRCGRRRRRGWRAPSSPTASPINFP